MIVKLELKQRNGVPIAVIRDKDGTIGLAFDYNEGKRRLGEAMYGFFEAVVVGDALSVVKRLEEQGW